jgi:hypothetical protein
VARSTSNSIKFRVWVPQAAQNRISELCRSPLGADKANRALLERLATDEAMRTEVWEKLPPEPANFQGEIIAFAFHAYTTFRMLACPYPKTGSKATWLAWAKHREKNEPLTDPLYGGSLAQWLSGEI